MARKKHSRRRAKIGGSVIGTEVGEHYTYKPRGKQRRFYRVVRIRNQAQHNPRAVLERVTRTGKRTSDRCEPWLQFDPGTKTWELFGFERCAAPT